MNRRLVLPSFLVLAAACNRAPELDTRTFELRHLSGNDAAEMVSAYVYTDRPKAPGKMSYSGNAFTVRETPDNLEKIERVLAQFDRAKPAVRLRFQLIHADGATQGDPAIADVEAALRQLFRFTGYQLLAQAVANGSEYAEFAQPMPGGPGEAYMLSGIIRSVRVSGDSGTVELTVRLNWPPPPPGEFASTVTLRLGQTAVLGNVQISRTRGTLILTVKPELMPN